MTTNESGSKTPAPKSIDYAYQLLMVFLCVYAILALGAGLVLPISQDVWRVLQYLDFAVCIAFFGDFLYCLYKAPNKLRYMYTWGWIDLLSSIPMIEPLRVGRLARVLRIIRVLRLLRATRTVAAFMIGKRSESAVFAMVAVVFTMIVFSSIAILSFEAHAGGNIRTAEDALWWAVTTVTTVGYGDRFPVTTEGRIVAALLMAVGVGLFGALSGLVASWFLAPSREKESAELAQLRAAIADLKTVTERHARQIQKPTDDAQQVE
jgi:voltage-gated potassium channel